MPERSIGPNMDPAKQLSQREGALDARVVQKIHERADTDAGRTALHHTLGVMPNQASPGNHIHDGTTSARPLSGFNLSGSRGGNAALPSIIACLVQLGATDNTTA